jgi:hypothetical protein
MFLHFTWWWSQVTDCIKSAKGYTGLCISHGGGRRLSSVSICLFMFLLIFLAKLFQCNLHQQGSCTLCTWFVVLIFHIMPEDIQERMCALIA